MSLKKIYYSIENKYYEFVEKTGLYKITDKIDRFMPSMVFFLLLLIIIVAGILFFVSGGLTIGVGENTVSFKVLADGIPLSSVSLQVTTSESGLPPLVTDEDGLTEYIKIKNKSKFTVDLDYSVAGFKIFKETYTSQSNVSQITINLEKEEDPNEKINYNFSVVNENSQIITNASAYFSCSNEDVVAPGMVSTTNGIIEVEANVDCELIATVSAQGYETNYTTPITTGLPTVTLVSEAANFSDLYNIDIYINDNSGSVISNIKVALYSSQGISLTNCLSNTSGYCKIEGVEVGSYELRTTDQRSIPEYSPSQTEIYISGNDSKTINLSREVSGYIKVKVYDSSNNALENAHVSLKKYVDQDVSDGYTNADGIKLFTVGDSSLEYRVVVDVEGYVVEAKATNSVSSVPAEPTVTFNLEQVSENTYSSLHISVLDELGKGYSHAKVVLYDSETGFMTDFGSKTSNYDGNVTFYVPTGNYYAFAIKGSSTGQSNDFYFDARQSDLADDVIIPMSVSKGYLVVNVVNKDYEPVPNTQVKIFDSYNGNDAVGKSDLPLTDVEGRITFEIGADEYYYAVVSDPLGELGTTQSAYVRVNNEETTDLEVVLYNKRNASYKPELVFNGLYSGSKRMSADLKAGKEYEAKFTLFIPSDREGDSRLKHIGAIISVGDGSENQSSQIMYMENDSILIKDIDMSGDPSVISLKKYTAYEDDQDYLDLDDLESETRDESKWVSVIVDEDDWEYHTAYEITTTIKIKDEAAFGQDLKINYLGYGYNKDRIYEVKFRDGEGELDEITSKQLMTSSFNVGDESACDSSFCFNMIIVNQNDDLKETVQAEYSSKPGVDYKANFTIINNSDEEIYKNARLQIKNLDEALDFSNIVITEYDGDQVGPKTNIEEKDFDFDISLNDIGAKQSIRGLIEFSPVLKGDRHLLLNFISDQQVIFSKNIIIHVLSDKTLEVEITPQVIPAYKDNLNIQLDVKDSQSSYPVYFSNNDDKVMAILKDKYLQNIGDYQEVGENGEVSLAITNALQEDDVIYVYVQAPGYETYIEEVQVTDDIFSLTPNTLGVSLNVNTKKNENIIFKINNLIENDIIIDSIILKGQRNDLDIIDAVKINNALTTYEGLEISGINSDEVTENFDISKEINLLVSVNPKAEYISEVQNIKAYLVIIVQDKYDAELKWEKEIPISITVGFDGVMDDSTCLVLSENSWEEVVLNGSSQKQFMFTNGCRINTMPVKLNGGLKAKVEFESNPLGKFTLNVGNRLVELSHGYYKTVFDAIDIEKQYPVVLKYTPVGRYTGDITGKIIFKSINETTNGPQELISEYKFNLHVISLEDCYVLSNELVKIKNREQAGAFTIENKGCGMPTVYRLSCDECSGLDIQPYQNIEVDATGSSGDIIVSSDGAIPGIYLLNIYSKVQGQRGSEKNVGKIKVEVHPSSSKCLDLERYEFNLYRSTISENTGEALSASSYDTTNLVNTCYKQKLNVQGKVGNNSKMAATIGAGLRSFVSTFVISGAFQTLTEYANTKDSWLDTPIGRGLFGKTNIFKTNTVAETNLEDGTTPPELDVVFRDSLGACESDPECKLYGKNQKIIVEWKGENCIQIVDDQKDVVCDVGNFGNCKKPGCEGLNKDVDNFKTYGFNTTTGKCVIITGDNCNTIFTTHTWVDKKCVLTVEEAVCGLEHLDLCDNATKCVALNTSANPNVSFWSEIEVAPFESDKCYKIEFYNKLEKDIFENLAAHEDEDLISLNIPIIFNGSDIILSGWFKESDTDNTRKFIPIIQLSYFIPVLKDHIIASNSSHKELVTNMNGTLCSYLIQNVKSSSVSITWKDDGEKCILETV